MHKTTTPATYPGAKELTLQLVYDRKTARLLGGQAFGHAGRGQAYRCPRHGPSGKLTLHDLAELDLAYAPPYSSANDPVNLVAFVGLNDISGDSPLVTAGTAEGQRLASAEAAVRTRRTHARRSTAGRTSRARVQIGVNDLRTEIDRVPRDRRIVVHCRVGFRGHLALRILKGLGFQDVANVTGGFLSMIAEGGFPLAEG
ncbi:MAG: hypothetical protein IPQ07_37315 [Myxococcales bacterium]|nr:hypothetical protein [Myxococcales bacterium]